MGTKTIEHDVTDLRLAGAGAGKIAWAGREMPVLRRIAQRFAKERPLAGVRVGACLHVTAETANLAMTLRDGGASVALAASNPLSTQDDVAAALAAREGIAVFAKKGEDRDTYYGHINAVLATKPELTMDDGADLVTELHTKRRELLPNVRGGTEETTTGVNRLRAMAAEGVLAYPIIAVNDAFTKHLFDNRFGTGQSAVDGILRATNLLLAGRTVAVVGYGWVGRGIASRLRGMGAITLVCEVDPLRGLEAAMEGFEVTTVVDAATRAGLLVTATGNVNVIGRDAIDALRDGAVLANAGHFNDEIDLAYLGAGSASSREVRPLAREHVLKDGRRIVVLADGRLVNLASAEGHPAAVMDMSFANQALAVEHLVKNSKDLEKRVYPVPREIDLNIAAAKLAAMGMRVDEMTEEQRTYAASWKSGT